MIGNGQRRRKLVRLGCTAAASMIVAASWPLCGPAVAAGVPTVRVGPNKVLRPGWPVEVQECQPDPVSLNDCDMLTTLGYDQLTKRRVEAKPNGSVTIHFLVWAPLPNRWDTGSVIKVGPGHPTALWIGQEAGAPQGSYTGGQRVFWGWSPWNTCGRRRCRLGRRGRAGCNHGPAPSPPACPGLKLTTQQTQRELRANAK